MTIINKDTANVKLKLANLFQQALKATLPDELTSEALIAICEPKFGDYKCNNVMGIWNAIKSKGTRYKGPVPVAKAIIENLPASEIIESCQVAGPGYINIKLSRKWISKSIQKMLINGIDTMAPKLHAERAIVDFSSPNIAKEMHVGHLRSTIIGDTLARMLEFSDVQVFRRNHVGDWGTQFGMLLEYLFEKYPNLEDANDLAIEDLQAFYKAAGKRFGEDLDFAERAHQAVVSLQAGVEKHRALWARICEISRMKFQEVYERLGVQLEEKGESFYNPYIPSVLELLKDLIEESEGARVIFVKGEKVPLIVVKRDGGYNYATTDLAALWYRLNEEKADWIIYVTDAGQKDHFKKFFSVAKTAGWLPSDDDKYPKLSHVQFGVVCDEHGKKLKTRSGEAVKLVDLLDEAKNRCKAVLVERGKAAEWTSDELDQTAESIGYGAVKYADLKNNRLTEYKFDYDQMLNDKGNTAVYLLYAYARICSIIRKSGKDIDELKKAATIELVHPSEGALGLHLLQFSEAIEDACTTLLPSVLCDYLYGLSESFTKFYSTCQVVGSAEESSRLLLCQATATIMSQCFNFLGITPVSKI
jgi:arginyl-tRNA synthetase